MWNQTKRCYKFVEMLTTNKWCSHWHIMSLLLLSTPFMKLYIVGTFWALGWVCLIVVWKDMMTNCMYFWHYLIQIGEFKGILHSWKIWFIIYLICYILCFDSKERINFAMTKTVHKMNFFGFWMKFVTTWHIYLNWCKFFRIISLTKGYILMCIDLFSI